MGFYQDGKQVAVAEKRNVYFYGSPALSRDFLREVARRAGVHLYLESGDNLYASRDVVSIHASHRGDKTIRLPERSDVVDVYTGEVLAKDVQEVTFPMEAFQSRVLMLGKAEEILGDSQGLPKVAWLLPLIPPVLPGRAGGFFIPPFPVSWRRRAIPRPPSRCAGGLFPGHPSSRGVYWRCPWAKGATVSPCPSRSHL